MSEIQLDHTKVFRTLIVEASIVTQVRQMAAALPAGAGMFIAAYAPVGSEVATHYVSEGWIEKYFADALSSAESLRELLLSAGVDVPLVNLQFILSKAIVSEVNASSILADMQLEVFAPNIGV